MSSSGPGTYRDPSDTFGVTLVSLFAGVLLVTLGGFEILQGLSAVLKDDVFVTGLNYTYELNVAAWGWVNMLIGAIGVAAGIGILKDQVWASVVGIVLAVVSALGQFAFMPYYPFWSMLIIAIDILVIWALAKQIGQA
jgi:hypothetical protein